jgi:hypothetical protein
VVTFHLPARPLIVAGACAVAIAAGPGAAVLVGQSASPHPLADPCGGGINMTILAEGVPVSCGQPLAPPVTSGGAPTQEILTACANRPGCLSNALYGPGRVPVPNRDTTVRQSQ